MRNGLAFLLAIFAIGMAVHAQPLNDRVLVVHNTSYPASIDVADYYVSRRAIPAANRCAITSTVIVKLTWADYDAKVRQPVQACLDAVGRNNILYIVFSYQTPYRLTAPNGLLYSLDHYVADIWDAYTTNHADPWPQTNQPYFADAQSEGGYYPPFTPMTAYRLQPGAIPIYSVWRLDAANTALAKGLVDKAIQAELTGLTGQGCFDRRSLGYDTGAGTGEWDIRRSADFARLAGFPVTEDGNTAEFGTAPAPLRCDNAAMYAGWYSFNKYFDVFTWNPGAIGMHLDSASATDPRGGTNWVANAVQKGITIASGATTEPYLTGMAHPDIVFRSLLQGANAGDAFLRATQWLKWMILNVGDPLYRPFPGGRAPFNLPLAEAALILNPPGLVGPVTSEGIVQLDSPAPPSGTVVTLSSSLSTVASVPASVTVPAGQRFASFPISVNLVTVETNLKITANVPSGVLTNTLLVVPLLGGLRFDSSVTAGQPFSGLVLLQDYAPPGGITVQLESSHPSLATVPPSVNIPGGDTQAIVQVTTAPVSVKTNITITARYAGAAVTASVRLDPAISSVTLTPPSGATGATRSLKVNLFHPAIAGTSISLTSSNPSALPVPASVPVPEAATTVTVTLTNGMTPGSSTITASYAGDSRTVTGTTVLPALSAISVSTSITGGNAASGTVTLDGVSPSGTVVTLSSNNAAASPPPSVTVPGGSSSVTFQVPTSPVANPVTVTITGTSGVSKTDTLVVNPPALQSLALSPASLIGGVTGTGTVTLTANAPAGGSLVALSSANSAAQVPANVTVPAGAKTVTFQFTTTAVSATTTGTLSAVFRGVTKSANLTVQPAALTSVSVLPASVQGGSGATGTVQLSGIAPAQGVVISLSTDKPEATVPTSVTVPAGSSGATFAIATSDVTQDTNVKVIATLGSKTVSATLTVTP